MFTGSSFNREHVMLPTVALLDVLETIIADAPGELGADADALCAAARKGTLRQAVSNG